MSTPRLPPIRSAHFATPALASLVVATAYLLGAIAFAIAARADQVPLTLTEIVVASPAVIAASAGSEAMPEPVSIAAAPMVPVDAALALPAPPRPRIAVVIDDVGLDAAATARVLALDAPVTVAILPYAERAAAIARAAIARDHDVLVHVPMEPLGLADPGPHALRIGLAPEDLQARMRWSLARIPGAIGLNNHMGSRFTQDPQALRTALSAIAGGSPLFLDSMTTAESRAADVARGLGLAVLQRDVFLDHVLDAAAINGQLALTETIAREQGHAVLIGHPHGESLAALELWMTTARAAGFEFVTVSQLSAGLDRPAVAGAGAAASILN